MAIITPLGTARKTKSTPPDEHIDGQDKKNRADYISIGPLPVSELWSL